MRARLLAPLALAAAAPPAARAQIRASEPAAVAQTVDGTRLTVEYYRPRVRGRSPIFGGAPAHAPARWGRTWTPGANWATTLEVSRDVRLDGHPVPKGKYSVWMVPRDRGPWTFVLDPRSHLFHEEHPDSTPAQIRFPVRPDSAPFTEVLTWSFPDVRSNSVTLAMQWETVRVPVRVEVPPSLTYTLPAADAAAYVGAYDFRETTPDYFKERPTFLVSYEGGTLKGEWAPMDRYFKRFALIRVAPDLFTVGLYDEQGQIYEVIRPDLMMQFTRDGGPAGRVRGFEMRMGGDSLAATGTRRR